MFADGSNVSTTTSMANCIIKVQLKRERERRDKQNKKNIIVEMDDSHTFDTGWVGEVPEPGTVPPDNRCRDSDHEGEYGADER